MKYSRTLTISSIVVSFATKATAFSPLQNNHVIIQSSSSTKSSRSFSFNPLLSATSSSSNTEIVSFIDTELRGAAMKLHTRSQAPKEGEAKEKPKPPQAEPYVPTHMDYLKFLVDSQYVYKTFENIVQRTELHPELKPFTNTKLERNDKLEQDITFIMKEYDLERPEIGEKGKIYAEMMEEIAQKGKEHIPEFMCHYYNYYFAHTAGGRMIGKQMAALLLDKKTLEFYKVSIRGSCGSWCYSFEKRIHLPPT